MKTFQLDTDIQHNNNRILKDSSNIVSQITDKVQNIAFTQSTSTCRPIYNYNGYYSFDGANDYIENDDTDFTLAQQEFTIVIKSTLNATSGKQRIIGQWDSFKFAEWFFDYNLGYRFVISKTGSYANSFQLNWNSDAPLSTSINVINCQVVGQTVTLSLISAAEDGTYTRLREKITTTLSQLFPSPTGTKSPFVLGRLRDSAGVWTYGNVDLEYVRIYDKALFDMTNVNNDDILGDNTWLNMFDQPFTWYKRYKETDTLKFNISTQYLKDAVVTSTNTLVSLKSSVNDYNAASRGTNYIYDGDGWSGSGFNIRPNLSAMGTQDFFMSGWMKITTTARYNYMFNAGIIFGCDVYGSGTGFYIYFNGTKTSTEARVDMPQNEWFHYACCRKNGVAYTFVNGTLRYQVAFANSLGYSSNYFLACGTTANGNRDDLYIEIGNSVVDPRIFSYKGHVFNPPSRASLDNTLTRYTTAGIAWQADINDKYLHRYPADRFNQFFLTSNYLEDADIDDANRVENIRESVNMLMNRRYIDTLGYRSIVTDDGFLNGSEFYSCSIPFPNIPDYLQLNQDDFFVGVWAKPTGYNDNSTFISMSDGQNDLEATFRLFKDHEGKGLIWQFSDGATVVNSINLFTTSYTILNVYNYYSANRVGDNVYIYINGNLVEVLELTANYVLKNSTNIILGNILEHSGRCFIGYLDDFYLRIKDSIVDPTGYVIDEQVFRPPLKGGVTSEIMQLAHIDAPVNLYPMEFTIRLYTDGEVFTVPHLPAYNYDYDVDYGDGNVATVSSYDDANTAHTYALAGDYTISITGICDTIYFTDTDRRKLIGVESLGSINFKRLYFYQCDHMQSFDCGVHYNLTELTSVDDMFFGCGALSTMSFPYIPTGVTSIDRMFNGCHSMTSIDVSNWNLSNIVSLTSTFDTCNALTSLDVNNWDVSNVELFDSTFARCYSITTFNASNWNTSSATSLSNIFYYCSGLHSLDLSNWNVSSVESLYQSMTKCATLTSVDTTGWNTSSVTDMRSCFSECTALTTLDISSWNTSSVTDMRSCFSECTALTTLDTSSWNTLSVTDMSLCFSGCTALTTLDTSSWNMSSATNVALMFYGCSNITNPASDWWLLATIQIYVSCYTDNVSRSNYNSIPSLWGGGGA